jgi:tetratricopeptide (TPR) repeat protein
LLKKTFKLWSPSLLALVQVASVSALYAKDAADEITEPINMKPEVTARIYTGDKLLGEGKWPQALTEFDAAMTLDPKKIEPPIDCAAKLSSKGDPLLCYMALRYLKAASLLNAQDQRVILLKANVEQKLGNKKAALALFEQDRAIILADKTNKGDDAMLLETMIKDLKRQIDTAKPPPVKVEDRHYEMNNVAAVYITTGAICKLAIYGGHDPDGGKQDGTDDGIIEFKKENINSPDKVFRRKKDN